MPLSGQVDLDPVPVGAHHQLIAADGHCAEVGGDIQRVGLEPLQGAPPPLSCPMTITRGTSRCGRPGTASAVRLRLTSSCRPGLLTMT